MLSDHFSGIEGISLYPVISLIFCFIFFAAAIYKVARLDKKYLTRMENLPLETFSENKNNSEMINEVTQ